VQAAQRVRLIFLIRYEGGVTSYLGNHGPECAALADEVTQSTSLAGGWQCRVIDQALGGGWDRSGFDAGRRMLRQAGDSNTIEPVSSQQMVIGLVFTERSLLREMNSITADTITALRFRPWSGAPPLVPLRLSCD
jgi:hypothetical protein